MMVNGESLFWSLFLMVIAAYGSPSKEQVCIIGAGLGGLITANQLSKNNITPIVFEKASDIGGQWKYTDNTDVDEHGLPVHSSVYKNLRTNGVKALMSIQDYHEFGGENRSYVKHETVLEYLRNYTDHFNLRQYIQLDTLVEKVSPMQDKGWRVETRNLNLNKSEIHECDAVVICSGHFTKPYSPKIPGLDTFPGRTLHSHTYRHPEEFANKTVVILGASFSGVDIGVEITNYAKKVYLSHRHKKLPSKLPKNMIQIPGVVAANGSDLILSDGKRVKADAFLFCTGYLYEYPFLDESAGISVIKGKYVHPLYKQVVNILNPTMFLIGLLQPDIPFLLPGVQAQYVASVLRGKLKLPSREVMLKESPIPKGPLAKNTVTTAAKAMFYYNNMAKATGIEPLSFAMKKLSVINVIDIVRDPINFKDNELFIRNGRVVYIRKKKNLSDKLLGSTAMIFTWGLEQLVGQILPL